MLYFLYKQTVRLKSILIKSFIYGKFCYFINLYKNERKIKIYIVRNKQSISLLKNAEELETFY